MLTRSIAPSSFIQILTLSPFLISLLKLKLRRVVRRLPRWSSRVSTLTLTPLASSSPNHQMKCTEKSGLVSFAVFLFV